MHLYTKLLDYIVTVLAKTSLVCTSDFANLKDHKMLLDGNNYRAETFIMMEVCLIYKPCKY